MRDKIFREQFEDFNEFIVNFEKLKEEYNAETVDGDQ